ncbi:MAG: GntR family transcriptional regulator [Hahellaceae bacterium]|nr:GntR family transcriptional regulator [Hahellaceae bacterium]
MSQTTDASADIKSANKQQTLSDQVFDRLQTDIVKGVLHPGQKCSEAELATSYGVGRGPLREAIMRLEGRGLIVKRPHSGISVVSLGYQELIDIYYVREALEGMACRLAAENMSTVQIDELKALLEQHKQMVSEEEWRSYYQKEGDFDFHYRIVKGSGNQKLYQSLCGELYHLVRMYRYRLSMTSGRPAQALKEHANIVDAIAARDGELAEMLMRRHISAARKNIQIRYDQGLVVL